MMMKKVIMIFVTTIFLSLLVGCETPKKKYNEFIESDKIKIVASTTMLADLAKNITGNRAIVHQLMKPGVDPHTYVPTKLDVDFLLSADVILLSGLKLEAQAAEVLKQIKNRGVTIIEAGDILLQKHNNNYEDGVKLLDFQEEDHEDGHEHGLYDPHFWFNVDYWILVTRYLTDELSKLYPEHQDYFELRYQNYLSELNQLNIYLTSRIAEIPLEKRILVTAHDAFGYFGERYGFRVSAVLGISTVDEASTKDIENLVDLVVSENVEVIFIESSVPQKTINSIIESARVRKHTIRIGGELFSDTLGDPDGKGNTYVNMMKDNIDTIVDAINNN
jgi:manganese/zinc/iron transport system substrate-binding protein